jgi:PIN domain nuclease of toxin-antitoxin system
MSPRRLLLDTHVFLWWRIDDVHLDPPARDAIAQADVVAVSTASAWEAAIKIRLGRQRLPEPFSNGVAASGFAELPVRFAHAERAAELPRHHDDPFDRMLVAQAEIEGLTLVTHDSAIWQYDVSVLRV